MFIHVPHVFPAWLIHQATGRWRYTWARLGLLRDAWWLGTRCWAVARSVRTGRIQNGSGENSPGKRPETVWGSGRIMYACMIMLMMMMVMLLMMVMLMMMVMLLMMMMMMMFIHVYPLTASSNSLNMAIWLDSWFENRWLTSGFWGNCQTNPWGDRLKETFRV